MIVAALFLFFGRGFNESMSGDESISKEISEILTWIARHDATCGERHKGMIDEMKALQKADIQHRVDLKAVEVKTEKNRDDISALKQKIAFWAGLASAGGGVVGTALSKLFSS